MPKPMNQLTSPEAFFANTRREGACLIWLGQPGSNGYGRVRIDGQRMGAHRAAWIHTHGPIAAELLVCHRCDVPMCVEPTHLFLGTPAENMHDRDAKGRGVHGDAHWTRRYPERVPHGPRGPRPKIRGAGNPNAKLDTERVVEIRRRYAAGETQATIADRFGVTQVNVSAIVRGQIWKETE